MKKLLFFCLLGFSLSTTYAQTQKGDWMTGGNFRLNTSDNNTQIGFTPDIGGFIVDNLAIGGSLSLIYNKIGTIKSTVFGVGPFVRYYFGKEMVRPILHGNINFVSQKTKTGNSPSTTNNGVNYFLGGGAAFFLSDQVSIDGLAGYAHSKYNGVSPSGGFALSVGFQVYILKKQMDKL